MKRFHVGCGARLLAAAVAVLLAGCTHQSRQVPSVSGGEFRDAAGRALLPHGINVANKNREQGYTGGLVRADFARIRSWKMNCIRLAIFWDAIEPEPGRIDQKYLDRVAALVEAARSEKLYVLLDMHQDLYSVKFSDGAPSWATLDEGRPHTKGAVWSDAYYTSEAVQTALDNFWANAQAADGIGLQEHYAGAWQAVARRFADEPAVLGYDLMNEPFPGRDAPRAQQAGLIALSKALAAREGAKAPAPEALGALFISPEGRRQLTARFADLTLFRTLVDAAAPLMQDFERTRLQPMYQRVANAIRKVDSRHILFLETPMAANLGVPSALQPVTDAQGQRDPQQAFAPHAYDIVVDTASVDLNNRDRVRFILNRHAETANRLAMPMLIGEWGAFYLDSKAVEPARFLISEFDRLRCGDAYWSYEPKLGESPLLGALARK